ncbi:putative bifunctional diguanylate cyclase/phosphodiesterase [Novosphingobium sp. Leaf2]|uniref:putative bifunctional diguanylate cyclase/phosphodiesterase n=1 Tax=Novosphingobium sp. Leaf2 TaxID=1735670 RepID=UPI000AD97362|nr:EAL domain-containing protein [Novosphingobium sp. Leaf2]
MSNTALLTVLVFLSVLTSGLIVSFLVSHANTNADRLAAVAIAGAIDRERSRISNEAYINAHWDDAFAHAYGSMQDPWIESQWGTPIGLSYVIDAHGRTLYAHLPGGREPPLDQLIGSRTLAALLASVPENEAAVRRRRDAVVLIGKVGKTPALIAFSPIVREKGPATLDRSSYRIFVDIRLLDHTVLDEWEKGFGLQDLRWLANGAVSPDEASTDVRDWSGGLIGTIAWKRLAPGSLALRELLPMIGLCIALFLAVAAMIARRVRSLSREITAHSQTAAEAGRHEREARLLADSDGLTGLYNRRRFYADLESAATPATLNAMTVGLVDLDRFKPVNDTFGHPVGDRLLVEVARLLRDTAGPDATLYRIGGDEFGMIVRLDAEAALRLAETMCAVVAAPMRICDRQVSVGASIGLAAYSDAQLSPTELAKRADHALYHAKREKPGQAVQFSPQLERRVTDDHIIEAELQSCELESELRFDVQPIVSMRTGAIVGGELLARWTSARLGVVEPQRFVEIAERSTLIHKLTRNAMRSALELLDVLPADRTLAVNVSACDLHCAETVNALLDMVGRSRVDHRRLCIEVTETAVMRNLDAAIDALARFRAMGLEIALDDFGTGYSSLSNLHRLPLDKVKIDRSFAWDLDNAYSMSIVHAVVGLCNSLGLACIVEGVETIAQATKLQGIGCDLMQGYLFSYPLDPVVFADLSSCCSPEIVDLSSRKQG